MIRVKAILLLLAVVCGSFRASFAAEPGQRPPRKVLELAQPALQDGRRALESKDAVAVRAAVAKAIAVLGPWAGNPETATRHYPPVVTKPFDAAKARDWWLKEVQRGVGRLPWVKNPTGDPRTMQAGLR